MNKDELKKIVDKYELFSISKRLEELDKDLILKIGFLGEFSSGKSTLINRIIDRKVLPVMNEPTSKTIVEIEGVDGLENVEYYSYKNNKLEKISALDFSEIAVKSTKDILYLKVPQNDFLKNNYLFIDTPGITSIDKSDTDITFGYLPLLDGAVICSDINFGAIPKSLENFLLKPEVKLIINNFIFAITKADTLKEPEKVKENIIKQLNRLNEENSLGLMDIENKVVLISKFDELDTLKNSFNDVILKRKEIFEKERKDKILIKIADEVLKLLEDTKKNSDLNLDEILQKEKEIEKDMERLSQFKYKLFNKIESFSNNIRDYVYNYIKSQIPNISNVKSEEDIENIFIDIQSNIGNKTSILIKRYFEEVDTSFILDDTYFSNIQDEILSSIKNSNMFKQIGTFVLFSAILPGAGIAANAAEGAGALVVREAGKVMIKETVKKSFFKVVGEILNHINPIELIGNSLQKRSIKKKLEENLLTISDNVTFLISNEVENILSFKFEENRIELNDKREILYSLQEAKNRKAEEFFKYLSLLDSDIVQIRNFLKGK